MDKAESKKRATCPHCRETYRVCSATYGKHFTCSRCGTHFEVDEIPPPTAITDPDMMICKIALNCGLLTEKQLEKLLTEFELRKQGGEAPDLEKMLCDSGMIEQANIPFVNQVHKGLKFRQVQKRFLEIAMARGYIGRAEAKEALVLQNTLFRHEKDLPLVGALLVRSGKISTEQRAEIMRIQGRVAENELASECEPELDISEILPDMKSDRHAPAGEALVEDRESPEPVSGNGENQGGVAERIIARAEASGVVERIMARVEIAEEAAKSDRSGVHLEEREQAGGDDRSSLRVEAAEHDGESDRTGVRSDETEQAGGDDRSSLRVEAAEQSGVADRIRARATAAEQAGVADRIRARAEAADQAGLADRIRARAEEGTQPMGGSEEPEPSGGGEEREKNGGDIAVQVSDDAMEARLLAPEGFSGTLSVEGIRERLGAEGIVYGIVEDALISGFAFSSAIRSKPFVVAKGDPAVAGVNGSLEYLFETSYLKTGTLNADGEIDYKDRGEIPYVKEGTLLAKITPHIQGENGRDVYGNLVEVELGRPVKFRCEKGTRLSGDGRDVFAAVDGHPKAVLGNRIFVLNEINVNGDVGYETGHVEFEGNVSVNGTLQEGFSIRGADITVREISGGEIEATGDLTVEGGITGGRIAVHGNVKARYINRSQVKAYGDVIVEKEIIDSKIENSGACRVNTGKIISSGISSRQGIDVLDIGTDMSDPCHLRVGARDHAAGEIAQRELAVAEKNEELGRLEERLEALDISGKEIHREITGLAQIQDRSMIEKRDLEAELERMDAAQAAGAERRMKELEKNAQDADTKINLLFDNKDAADGEINAVKHQVVSVKEALWLLKNEAEALAEWTSELISLPLVKARGTIRAGTRISGAEATLTLAENRRNVRIREVMGAEEGEPQVMEVM